MHWDKRTGKMDGRQPRVTSPRANLLINGDFQIAQRGAGPFTSGTTPVNNNDTYLLDQWNYLANGSNTCNVSQDTTDTPTGARACMLLTVVTGNRKFGAANFVETAVAAPLLNQLVSLSFKAKVTGSSISNIRAGVISWTSTADTITSDPVSSWGAAGTNPSLAANWTFENTPDNLAVSTSWTSYSIENVLVDSASMTNVGVFIWVDDTDATAADALRLADVKLEVGANATELVHRSPSLETTDCNRFFMRQNFTTSDVVVNGFATAATIAIFSICAPTPMRIAPTFSSSASGGNFHAVQQSPSVVSNATTFASANTTSTQILSFTTACAGLTTGAVVVLQANATSQWIAYSAEL